MSNCLKTSRKVHFFGIGGIGISALARMMLAESKEVSGSEVSLSPLTAELEKLGARISEGQSVNQVPPQTDLIIYSKALEIAVPELLREIRALGRKTLSYPEALSLVSEDKYTIAVSGTHGKTTTTAMLGTILMAAGWDPTMVVGSLLKDRNSNFVFGRSRYFVVEADEYLRSFLNLYPKLLIITNIDLDHLDYYKDLADIQSAFREFALRVPENGFVVCKAQHPHILPVLQNLRAQVLDYETITARPRLKLPGKHNLENARAALGAARVLGVPDTLSLEALASFAGTARRFEYKGETKNGVIIYDDYAHNPQKVRAALEGAREVFPKNKIIAVFQPHLFSRTRLLLEEFAGSFKDADEVIILPIYAAREKDDGSVSHSTLAEAIRRRGKLVQALSFSEVVESLARSLLPGDVLVTLGAGEAFKVGDAMFLT